MTETVILVVGVNGGTLFKYLRQSNKKGKNHQGALVTIADRVSKFALIKKVNSKHAEAVTEATIILLQPYLD
ncbi:MAG: hypothetical protein Q7T40_10990 [Methylobacter sp.]|nr:hypothetical protein [Methylobacter sp.]